MKDETTAVPARMDEAAIGEYIEQMPDEVFTALTDRIGFSAPWQDSPVMEATDALAADGDGFDTSNGAYGSIAHIRYLQAACWAKFYSNPQIRTATLDRMGRITGQGFGVSCDILEIDEYVRKISTDPRNRLYLNWPKYYGRSDVEGELFLALTLHKDGFVEVDFRDPGSVDDIYWHPDKAQMPLFYKLTRTNAKGGQINEIIPSIFIAYYPELWELAKGAPGYNETDVVAAKGRGKPYGDIGGFKRFIIQFDKTLITSRNVSHLSTTIQWVNHYENLKKYEIDHKKSSGAYVHTFSFEDKAAFRTWVALSDEERRATGLMQKLRPGSRLFLPPGMKHQINSPTLPKISDSDTDIMHMITAGVNQPEDMLTGQSTGTFASTKASRGPQADRMADEACYFENFQRYDFWRPVFFLAHQAGVLEATYKIEKVTDFNAKKPKKKKVPVEPCELLEFTFPTSAISDPETVARAYLGVKHGSLASTLGIPMSLIAKRLGFGNYRRLRLMHAAEEEFYPDLQPEVDQEAAQEKQIGEPQKTGGQSQAKTTPAKPAAKTPVQKPATPKAAVKASDTPNALPRRIPEGL